MRFEFKKIGYYTDQEIIDDVLKIASEVGFDSFNSRIYYQNGKYGSKAIKNHFGTWNKTLIAAGIPVQKEIVHLSKEDIFYIIEKLWMEKGSQPTLTDFENTHHTKKIIISNFGSWSKCLQEFCEWANNNHISLNSVEVVRHKTPREPSAKLWHDVLVKYNFKCAHCGRSTSDGVRLHVDHIIPYSKGGETTIDNLQVLCDKCNLGKGNSDK